MAASGSGATGFDTRGRYKTQEEAVGAVTTLLAAGAGVNERDGGGQTALHGAASRGWNELIKTLVASHADVMAKDARGRTAADVAAGSAGGASGRASSEAHPETAALLHELMARAMPKADVHAPAPGTQVATTQ
jgi:hypothetical protein